jgi:hypothetical protein
MRSHLGRCAPVLAWNNLLHTKPRRHKEELSGEADCSSLPLIKRQRLSFENARRAFNSLWLRGFVRNNLSPPALNLSRLLNSSS